MSTQGLSRREFVKLTGAVGASVATGGLLGCGSSWRRPRSLPRAGSGCKTLDSMSSGVVEELAGDFKGTLIRPGDEAYDQARQMWNRRFDHHPGLIARCRDPSDVVRTVELVRSEGLLVSVRSGGHSFGGYSVCDGGVVIDLSAMKQLRVDADEKVVVAGPGVLLGEIEEAAQAHGLATITGRCPGVGVSGYTLGGGEGSLTRKHGLACDNLLSARVVLTTGELVTASAEENPDLYWALRGGGGNFGVVTSFECRAHPVGQVLAGSILYRPDAARAALDVYREVMAEAPDELFVVARFGRFPPEPPVFMFHVVYAGDPDAGEAAARPLRGHGKPLADTLAPMSYLAAQRLEPSSPPAPGAARTGYFTSLSDAMLDAFCESCGQGPPGYLAQLVPLNGASSRVPVSATAFALRDPGYSLLLVSSWETPEQAEPATSWVYRAWQALRPFSHGAYVNLLEDEGSERVQEAYGANYARLAELKAVYDPDNVLRSNQNIAPAVPGGSGER